MKLITFSLLFLFAFGNTGHTQQKSNLDARYEGKIKRADKKISKGDAIVSKKEKYTKQIEEIEGEGKSRNGKIRRLETKANKIIITSSSYYKEGYSKKYSAYKKAVSNGLKEGILSSDAQSYISEAKMEYKNGRKLRRKSANLSSVNKAVALLLEANETEDDAIKKLIKATEQYKGIAITEEPVEELTQDSLISIPDSSSIEPSIPITPVAMDSIPRDTLSVNIPTIVDTIPVIDSLMTSSITPLNMDSDSLQKYSLQASTPIIEPIINKLIPEESNTNPELYFSVQFLAEKQSVTKERLNSLYDGPFEVVKHEAGGWFRYSFGRFSTIEEANEMKNRSGIEGYVVAYHKEVRISTRKAAELIIQ